jgi:hypothetical protein
MNTRNLLLAVAAGFTVMETADIPHTGVPAAVFAVVFLACAAWFWRRNSLVAVAVLSVQFLFEVTQAHTWHVGLPREIFAMVLGTIGLVAAAGVLVRRAVAPAPRS